MKQTNYTALKNYAIAATDRQYNIWVSYPLAVLLTNLEMSG